MTNKQEAKAIGGFLLDKLKESAKKFKAEEDLTDKDYEISRVIILRDLIKELKDGK